MRGHVLARYNISCEECNAGNYDIALQHWMIAANLGHEESLSEVKQMLMDGLASKADYAEALRGYQSAAEEMRSPDRDEFSKLDEVDVNEARVRHWGFGRTRLPGTR